MKVPQSAIDEVHDVSEELREDEKRKEHHDMVSEAFERYNDTTRNSYCGRDGVVIAALVFYRDNGFKK